MTTSKTSARAVDSTERERGATLTTKIRTTFDPGTVIEVEDNELLDLDRQGLIHSRAGDKGFAKGTSADKSDEQESGVPAGTLEGGEAAL